MVRFVVGIGVILVIVVAGLIAPAALRSYDLVHRVTLRCHVTSAEGITRGSSNRGIGGQDARVVITTEDCGKLVLWKGVTRTNNPTIAGRIDTPAEHANEVGAGGLLHAIGRSPSAFGVATTSRPTSHSSGPVGAGPARARRFRFVVAGAAQASARSAA